ncbi:hypothetical protein Hypma_005194 [Hypsizygus marmoreus]|uniref:Uncharacterized protein n=1 Tax=Hypsizygus marmoreus TaxID=39966 RepID=A0A369J3B3_HYPMA|nr:hypothetical protein Hypma_005194 [Hypsizygus marmoreus]
MQLGGDGTEPVVFPISEPASRSSQKSLSLNTQSFVRLMPFMFDLWMHIHAFSVFAGLQTNIDCVILPNYAFTRSAFSDHLKANALFPTHSILQIHNDTRICSTVVESRTPAFSRHCLAVSAAVGQRCALSQDGIEPAHQAQVSWFLMSRDGSKLNWKREQAKRAASIDLLASRPFPSDTTLPSMNFDDPAH